MSWLNDWIGAEPLYRRAELQFTQRHQLSKALYARVSEVPAHSESSKSVSAQVAELTDDLKLPEASDPETQLRVLTILGMLEINYDSGMARATWAEVESLAINRNHYLLASRAMGEQGIAAFLLGDIATAKKKVVKAWFIAKAVDPGAHIRYASMYGTGLVELHKFNEALGPLNEAIEVANKTPGVAYPTIAINAKIQALSGLGRNQEALVIANEELGRISSYHLAGHYYELYQIRAGIYERMGQWDKAVSDYGRAAGYAKQLSYWRGLIFQDVHSGGAAAIAGIEPGDILVALDGKEITPPEHPVFAMGEQTYLEVVGKDSQRRSVAVQVARPKGKKLQFVEPTLVESRRLADGVGYLNIAMFPGMIGVEAANAISNAVEQLGDIDRLIVDLRGNTGGGVGALRVMSFLTSGKIPVGFALDRKKVPSDLDSRKHEFPRFGSIPNSKNALWLLALKYAPAMLSKSPVVLETEGLGPKRFHGKITLLVNRHTASAAEMIVAFARENHLASVVGEKTAGRLLSATSVKVEHGFRLALPTGAYYTWKGMVLEGTPIEPDVLRTYDWREARAGIDGQLEQAVETACDPVN